MLTTAETGFTLLHQCRCFKFKRQNNELQLFVQEIVVELAECGLNNVNTFSALSTTLLLLL